MIFEGSEKKLEVTFNDSVGSLFEWPKVKELVASSEAQIISELTTDKCRAYLLSESSLFLWQDRLTMITCGQTNLANSAEFLIDEFGIDSMESFIFERKNEYFPRHQVSDFYDDVKRFKKRMSGSAYRFGKANEHHIFLFHMEKKYCPHQDDQTLEVLMYGLQGEAQKIFGSKGQSASVIRDRILSQNVLCGYEFDDFVFEPYGYSCNALKGDKYFTIHVTPQESHPYVSFETNACAEDYDAIVEAVLNIFKPQSFDVVGFGLSQKPKLSQDKYRLKGEVKQSLSCGYDVNYLNYYETLDEVAKATILEIEG